MPLRCRPCGKFILSQVDEMGSNSFWIGVQKEWEVWIYSASGSIQWDQICSAVKLN